jgi:hypothetical protein
MKIQAAVFRVVDNPRWNQEAEGHGYDEIYIRRRGPG